MKPKCKKETTLKHLKWKKLYWHWRNTEIEKTQQDTNKCTFKKGNNVDVCLYFHVPTQPVPIVFQSHFLCSIQVLLLMAHFIFSACKSLFSPSFLLYNNKTVHKCCYSSHISELLVLYLSIDILCCFKLPLQHILKANIVLFTPLHLCDNLVTSYFADCMLNQVAHF